MPAEPDHVRITVLGSGTSVGVPTLGCRCAVCASSDPLNRRLRTSVVVAIDEFRLLIYASIDLRQQALRIGMDRLDAVLLTHGHADHVFGLDDVRMYNYRQQRTLPVYGNGPTLDDVRRTFWYVFSNPGGASSHPQFDLRVIQEPVQVGPARVVPFEVMHGTVPILGYRVGSLAYITDASAISAFICAWRSWQPAQVERWSSR